MKQEKERLCWQGDPWGTPMEMLIRKLCISEFHRISMANPDMVACTQTLFYFLSF